MSDPELLEDHIFRLFEVEVTPGPTWQSALAELTRNEQVSRAALLDACLQGMERDFGREQAAWIKRLHDELGPSPEDIADRSDSYLRLLASRNPSTLDLALKTARTLDLADERIARELIRQLAPVLVARAKATARRAIRLLARLARLQPPLAPQAALAATDALLHEASEVQGAVLDLIEQLDLEADEAIVARLAELAPTLAPSVRSRVGAMSATPPAASMPKSDGDIETVSDRDEIEALQARLDDIDPALRQQVGLSNVSLTEDSFERLLRPLNLLANPAPRLDPRKRITPIQDLDELIDLCAQLLDGERTAIDIDRAVDGISRLCAERPSDFEGRTAPLLARAREKVGDNIADLPVIYFFDIDFSLLLMAWTLGTDFVRARRRVGVMRRLVRFVDQLVPESWDQLVPRSDYAWIFWSFVESIGADVCKREARQLLSTPTHEGGWLEPGQLVERIEAQGAKASARHPIDRALAILRLAPDGRDEALERSRGLEGELARAVRYALGGDEQPGRTESLWLAAARSRAPHQNDERVGRRFRRRASGGAWVAVPGRSPRRSYRVLEEPLDRGR